MFKRYKMLLAMTLPVLEEEVNRMIEENPSSKLVQAFFAQGTGFVGAMEYEFDEVSSAKAARRGDVQRRTAKPKARK
jgi:hypothetical protein